MSIAAEKDSFVDSLPFVAKLTFVVTEDWYFASHRLPLAVAAKKAGYDVSVITRVDRHRKEIENAGIKVIPFDFHRGGLNPLRDIATLWKLYWIYRREAPDIVHHVAMKPVLYGSLAAKMAGVRGVVNAFGGLGYTFSSHERLALAIRLIASPTLKVALRGAPLILQNSGDREVMILSGIATADQIRLIRGAGVAPELYLQTDSSRQPPLIILAARLLRDKGVGEFVEAARQLRAQNVDARFALIGSPDPENPASFTSDEVAAWVAEGVIEAWGWRDDMISVLAEAQIVVLPSYHEGLPKILLEAAAARCAIVASDIAGCRELVKDGITGLLVPPRDSQALVAALAKLIDSPILREHMGTAARHSIVKDFSLARVTNDTLMIYSQALESSGWQKSV